ncbi:MAG: 50S ribosomal protein L4 [Candidatus Dojkabacteria bacterium]|nr:50S ribosomal protein L4 [Candidatus Dojkabacteria bacterium]MDD4561262.1 50S ribosomal protein L4 [Candidatus Dojkabacteria bacterium]
MAEKKETKTKKEEKVILNPLVWEVPYSEELITQVLYVYNSNERKGSAKQKGKGEVSGGGKKPWRQKGTGRARSGSSRSPLWVGGGVTFPTSGRNFEKKINRKMAQKATRIMLSERLRNKELEFDKLTLTKAKGLRKGEVKRNLVIVSGDKEISLALRNVKKINIVDPLKLNAKHLVWAREVLVDESIINMLEKRLLNEK